MAVNPFVAGLPEGRFIRWDVVYGLIRACLVPVHGRGAGVRGDRGSRLALLAGLFRNAHRPVKNSVNAGARWPAGTSCQVPGRIRAAAFGRASARPWAHSRKLPPLPSLATTRAGVVIAASRSGGMEPVMRLS